MTSTKIEQVRRLRRQEHDQAPFVRGGRAELLSTCHPRSGTTIADSAPAVHPETL
jgi:hypothetical protein